MFEKFTAYIKKENLFNPAGHLLLAVSGGVDSVALCELCSMAGYTFSIAHCNFRLRGTDSDRDEAFVRSLAKKYGVEIFVKGFDTADIAKASKKSIEETARDLRYEWFHQLIEDSKNFNSPNIQHPTSNLQHEFSYIVTAHHADDNMETVMMNFFRGTGIRGLHGIQPIVGRVVRPLLYIRRAELEAFVEEKGLEFVTDHTNAENIYTRNFFRNEVIPLVQSHFPEASENLIRNIQRFSEAEILYNQAIELYKRKLLEIKGNEVHISVLKLAKQSPLQTILFELIRDYGFTAHQTDMVLGLLNSESGKYVQSATHRIIRNRKWLIIVPNQQELQQHLLIESADTELSFAGGTLTTKTIFFSAPAGADQLKQQDAHTALVDQASISFPLLLRPWKPGDYFYPLGMNKKKKLSRFFIDQKLSIADKEKVWVIESNKRIIWVLGMRLDDRFKIQEHTRTGLRISWQLTVGS